MTSSNKPGSMRIDKKNSKGCVIKRGNPIQVMINDTQVTAYDGELVASVLLAEGIRTFHSKHKTGRPSGIYCGMGVCYECLVTINGIEKVRACQTQVENGMVIKTTGEKNP